MRVNVLSLVLTAVFFHTKENFVAFASSFVPSIHKVFVSTSSSVQIDSKISLNIFSIERCV